MRTIPFATLERHLAQSSLPPGERIAWMTADHRRVREYVVSELLHAGIPLSLQAIASALALPPDRVSDLLSDLERRLTFLVRDAHGAVEWAFPVTTAQTPHRLTFDSGERLYGA
ncbi:MAG: hypothetical protein HZB53_09095 [Chloroflexi bacterium]|nr:hypothetical protein [Chloroflexota bacterium]